MKFRAYSVTRLNTIKKKTWIGTKSHQEHTALGVLKEHSGSTSEYIFPVPSLF